MMPSRHRRRPGSLLPAEREARSPFGDPDIWTSFFLSVPRGHDVQKREARHERPQPQME